MKRDISCFYSIKNGKFAVIKRIKNSFLRRRFVMKPKTFLFSTLIIILLFFLPVCVFGQEYPNYFAIKAGFYSPMDDLDDLGQDSDFNGEVAYGHYLPPNLGLELGLGYFRSDDVSVVPITLTGLAISKSAPFEYYGGIGVGIYFANFDGALGRNVFIDDDDYAFGINVGVGGRYDIRKDLFLGAEIKYLITTEAEFNGVASGNPIRVDANLNGLFLTVNLGIRF